VGDRARAGSEQPGWLTLIRRRLQATAIGVGGRSPMRRAPHLRMMLTQRLRIQAYPSVS
jgi:hypothetical protein